MVGLLRRVWEKYTCDMCTIRTLRRQGVFNGNISPLALAGRHSDQAIGLLGVLSAHGLRFNMLRETQLY